MHKVLLVALSVCVMTPFSGVSAPQVVESKIAEVTVFQDRARVTRVAQATLTEDETLVVLEGLPPHFDESSIQVSGESRQGIKILSTEVRRAFSEQTLNEEVKRLEDELEAIKDEMRLFSDETQVTQEKRNFLQTLRDQMAERIATDIKTAQLSTQQMKDAFGFYGEEWKQTSDKLRALEIERRKLQPRKIKIEQELARLKANSNKQTKQVQVALQGKGDVKLHVSYVVMGASWQPVYHARAKVDQSMVNLTYQGKVFQSTGEDWQGVRLSLSTARPQIGGRMPELAPWHLRFREILPMRKGVGMAPQMMMSRAMEQTEAMADMAMEEGSAGAEPPPPPMAPIQSVQAQRQSTATAMLFQVPKAVTIPSDGEPHQVTLMEQQFKGEFRYASTPKLATSAFLMGKFTNTSEAPILAGQVQLFMGDDFIGTSQLDYIAPSADFDFYFGVDDGIKITHKEIRSKEDTGGLIKRRATTNKKYEIKVENFKPTAVQVTLHEQLPVSQNSEIQVTNVKFSTPPAEHNKETGLFNWMLKLDPKATQTLSFEFTVEVPEGRTLDGF